MLKHKHKQTTFRLDGVEFTCDAGIRQLIVMLNKHGLTTRFSCEGEPNAYVLFDDAHLIIPRLPVLARGIFREHVIWLRRHRHMCSDDCRGMTITLEVRGSAICLRWCKFDYRRVLRMMKQVLEEMNP